MAIPYQVYQLSGSTLLVGLLGIVVLAPLLVTALVGGALADWRDRRRMVLLSELGLALATGVLLVNSLLPDPQLWVLFVVASIMAGLDGIQRPSLDALIPRLVSREELPAASALESFGFNIAEIGGPALAGVLIATIGLPVTYGLDIATFAVSLGALSLMKAAPPPAGAEPPSLRRIVEGFRFARSRPELVGTYSVDIVAMFFGMPLALFPAFAEEFGGPEVLGLLYAAPAAGALVASATSGWASHVHRLGVAVVLAASVWGFGVLVFGLAPGLPLALAGLAVAGAGDMVSGIFRTTIWNQTIPDEIRGRLAGIEQISYSSGPLLGHLRAGVVGSLVGIRFSAVSGGALCIVGVALTALALPAFWRLRRAQARCRGMTLYAVTGDAFARIEDGSATTTLEGSGVYCLTRDPTDDDVVYAGGRGSGIWKSEDGGRSWRQLDVPQPDVFSLAVSSADGAVYAGCEPSMLFVSRDGGASWRELSALREIPSAPTWSFPPRPWTSHVRWIAPSPHDADLLLAGIELGGVMRSEDGGETWADHRPGAQPDCHALAWHPREAGRAYEAGGGGAAWSFDGGDTWRPADEGRDRHYTWALAVDPIDPDCWYVSASTGPFAAHTGRPAEAYVYRWRGEGPWVPLGGLPQPLDSMAYTFAHREGLLFLGLANGTLYESADAGDSWRELPVENAPPRLLALA